MEIKIDSTCVLFELSILNKTYKYFKRELKMSYLSVRVLRLDHVFTANGIRYNRKRTIARSSTYRQS